MKKRYILLSTIAITASPYAALAETAPAPSAADTAAAPEIIVTGHAGAGIRKLEAGYSITTMSSADIAVQNPKSTGDLLKSVPGVWVESSGGVGTANVMVRGIPTTGDAPFLTMQLNGIPVFGANSPSFMDQTGLVRIDETVQGVEAVNGGPATVFSDGQPGLTTNILLREGHDQSAGSIKVSSTNYGARRIDGFVSGKLAEDTYYMVGGYYASGDSVRKAGFDTEKGGQFTANITRKFDIGKLNIFARYTDDHGEWFLPFATNVPGINQGTYNQLNSYNRIATIITPGTGPNGPTEQIDLGGGRGWKGVIGGGNLSLDLGSGIDFNDKFGFTKGTLQTMGLVPAGAGAITVATALAAGDGTAGQTVVSGVHTGAALASTDYVQQFSAWDVQKHLSAITNEAQVTLKAAGNKLTAGYYFNHFSSDDAWGIATTGLWMQVGGSGDVVNLNNAGAGTGGFNISEFGTADENAFYLADSYNFTEQLRLDAAIRYEVESIKFSMNNGTAVSGLNVTRHAVPWNVGLDYKATSNINLYVRGSKGYHIPSFDDVRGQIGNTGVSQDENWSDLQFEAGVKYHDHGLDLSAEAFWAKVSGEVYCDVGSNAQCVVAGSKTPGLEVAGSYTSSTGFAISADATLESAKTWAPGVTQNGISIDGLDAARIPKYQARITPSYKFGSDTTHATIYATFEALGKRQSDLTNDQPLAAYTTLSGGVMVEHNGISLQVAGDNLTNSHGLTEGNPRFVGGSNAALPDVRPIFGRSFKFTVGYKF